MSDRRPTLAAVLRRASESHLADVRISVPGKVVTYDPGRASVSVQPLIRDRVQDETGVWIAERLPVIPGVPVAFPRGGGLHLTFPIAPGDTGLILFSDSALDKWLSEGGEVDPIEPRSFSVNDAAFLPGVRPFKGSAAAAAAGHISIGADGASEEGAVMGETLIDFLGEIRAWIAGHTHAGNGSPPATTPPTVPSGAELVSSNVRITR